MADGLLEVIALDAADAVAAQAGGADRLELVSEMAADGLSPTIDTVRSVLAATDLPVRVMLRDAPGFRAHDLDGLRRAAVELRAAGATEFVLGFLTSDGEVDDPACLALLAELDGCAWTFHRAVDHAADRRTAFERARRLGCDTVLTAGGPDGVSRDLTALIELADALGPADTMLLAGGGLRAEHVDGLRQHGIRRFHVGGGVRRDWQSPVTIDRVRRWVELVHR
ncbi:copper homeostasis protein CutC [Actinoalloteichus hymeniacidonis]|uniref:Copper homeostasis protein cutC homolog n=1 Tax=Actinoalloteichus hymeniacidonis TaxID=340345 RepID=A0AAC9HUT4_9PSEU|nr:copper homeostasis protein CutC [Actinoalloteichus hymeniacidonis]AOS65853.1 copper homeostasis protein CutC [Actinoalloteichus hymeniacidonis]MBB5906053.1 copper homeostasis protein [Actinoalloteichus hymeniacidonis]